MNRQPTPSREWNSTAYHCLSDPQVSWGKRVLSRLSLRGDETVLDAGCGTGRLTADLAEALPRGCVVGVDLSENMLKSAREHLAPHIVSPFEARTGSIAGSPTGSRIHLLACDLLHLPFLGIFDVIVSTAAFHWVLDHDQLFKNLRSALVRGGWLEAQCGGGPNLVRLRERANTLMATARFAPFFATFREPWLFQDAQSAAATLSRAGFIEVETSVEAAPTVLQDSTRYREFIRNIIFHRHLEKLPTEELRAEFLDSLTGLSTKDDSPFELDYWRLNMRARST